MFTPDEESHLKEFVAKEKAKLSVDSIVATRDAAVSAENQAHQAKLVEIDEAYKAALLNLDNTEI